jgi:hypothetical protein
MNSGRCRRTSAANASWSRSRAAWTNAVSEVSKACMPGLTQTSVETRPAGYVAAIDAIDDAHLVVTSHGLVAVDFYDSAIIYDCPPTGFTCASHRARCVLCEGSRMRAWLADDQALTSPFARHRRGTRL